MPFLKKGTGRTPIARVIMNTIFKPYDMTCPNRDGMCCCYFACKFVCMIFVKLTNNNNKKKLCRF